VVFLLLMRSSNTQPASCRRSARWSNAMVLLGSAPSSICISYVFCSWCTVIWELLGSSESKGCGVLCHSPPSVLFFFIAFSFLSHFVLLAIPLLLLFVLLSLAALFFSVLGKQISRNFFLFLNSFCALLNVYLCNSQKWLTSRSISQCNQPLTETTFDWRTQSDSTQQH
jgi:hypothetical protein